MTAVLMAWLCLGVYHHFKGSENNVRATLSCYAAVQETYRQFRASGVEGKPTYAKPYAKLLSKEMLESGTAPVLMGNASTGYVFQECRSIGNVPIDWSKEFALCATPARYGHRGRLTFLVKTDGAIWARDLGKSQFVDDFPANPKAEGWGEAE